MSRVPYLVEARWGVKMGHQPLTDAMYRDGFFCPLSELVMGQTAEVLARQYGITREASDEFALGSQRQAEAAIAAGRFRDEITPALFQQWRGYAPDFPFVTDPFVSSSNSRRNSPVKQLNVNLGWSRSAHLLSFGGSWTQVNNWTSNTGSQNTPGIAFGTAADDPVNTGTTALFTSANFPNSTQTQRNLARDMYALLTGRVSSITRSLRCTHD